MCSSFRKWGLLVVGGYWLTASATANAAATNFDGTPVPGCSFSGTTYTCATSPSSSSDAVTLAASITVNMINYVNIYASTAALGANSVINGGLISNSTVAFGSSRQRPIHLGAGTQCHR